MWKGATRGRTVGMTVAIALLGAAPAGAEVRTGSGSDPVDAAQVAARDLVGVTASYDDRTGTVTATVTLREAPSAGENAFAAVSLKSPAADGSCTGRPAMTITGMTDPAITGGFWFETEDEHPNGPGTPLKSGDGATVTLTATDLSLRGRSYRCGTAQLSQSDDPTVIYDTLDTPLALRVRTDPRPAPDPGPGTTPGPGAAPPGALGTTGASGAQSPDLTSRYTLDVVRAARLHLSVVTAPVARHGRWLTARIRVSNTGGMTARRVRLTVRAPRGVQILRRTFVVSSLASGRHRTVTLRLRLGRRAAAAPRLRLVVTAKGVPRATGTLRVTARRARAPRAGAPGA